jgi:hypothetical protein
MFDNNARVGRVWIGLSQFRKALLTQEAVNANDRLLFLHGKPDDTSRGQNSYLVNLSVGPIADHLDQFEYSCGILQGQCTRIIAIENACRAKMNHTHTQNKMTCLHRRKNFGRNKMAGWRAPMAKRCHRGQYSLWGWWGRSRPANSSPMGAFDAPFWVLLFNWLPK